MSTRHKIDRIFTSKLKRRLEIYFLAVQIVYFVILLVVLIRA